MKTFKWGDQVVQYGEPIINRRTGKPFNYISKIGYRWPTSENFLDHEINRIKTELADRKARRKLKREQKRLDRLKEEASKPADSYLIKLMQEARAAQRLVKDARAYEAECWAKLSRYLLDGTRDDGKKPRVRIIIDHDDVPARGQQGAR
jgi:hypothetical protein